MSGSNRLHILNCESVCVCACVRVGCVHLYDRHLCAQVGVCVCECAHVNANSHIQGLWRASYLFLCAIGSREVSTTRPAPLPCTVWKSRIPLGLGGEGRGGGSVYDYTHPQRGCWHPQVNKTFE